MKCDRRQFLAASVAAPIAALRAAPAALRAAPTALLDRGFARVDKLTDGVFVTLANPAKGAACLSNGGVIVGRDAALLVEGHFRPEGARLEVDAARLVSNRPTIPIAAAVNTHFHLDHSFGNRGYANAGVPIIAHEQVPVLMRQQYMGDAAAARSRTIGALARQSAATIDPVERKRIDGDVAAYTWMFDAIDGVDLVLPTDVLKPSDGIRRIDLGGVEVLLECHTGHTPGDVTVSVPSRDVMFVGDLIFQREYPVALDADIRSWIRVLEGIAQDHRSLRIVAGHGPVCGRDAARAQLGLFDDLVRHADRMKTIGAGAEEAERRYTVPDRFREYAIFSWTWTVGGVLRSCYR